MTNMSTFKRKASAAVMPLARMLLNISADPRRITALRNYPNYRAQSRQFRKLGGTITHRYPVLTDYDAEAGTANGHYFHQDLLVASFVHDKNPTRHIDIGSRIDGFVAHVASFRNIEVMDIRALDNVGHPNISFIKADLMDGEGVQKGMADSVSCLHAIEHFGLGRYGDPLDPNGHIKGFNNIIRMLKPGGTLYISFPIGKTNEVHFNAHRVFTPRSILGWALDGASLKLERFDFVDDRGDLHKNVNVTAVDVDVVYGCGIYTFERLHGRSEQIENAD
jgi:SAM-dependent methyltransferase